MDALSGEVAATAYAYGGAPLLSRLLDLLLSGHTLLWRAMTHIGRLALVKVPYHNEIDLVGRIAFRELDYAGVPDGLPLDPSDALAEMADQIPGPTPEFEGEPYDLVTQMPQFDWPAVVISGQRDLTTPPPVAERIADLIPDAVLVRLATAAHSTLDTREAAALRIVKAVVRGQSESLPALADELDAMPGNQSVRLLVWAIGVAAALEARLPGRTATS
jgi:proline iminopeptidase